VIRVPRRSFLRGAAGLSLGLPLFESLACNAPEPNAERIGRAQGRLEFPKRLLVIYTPNGNWELPDAFDFTGEVLSPLAAFQQKILLLKGIDMAVHNLGPGEPHQQGMAFLTGRPLNEGDQIGGCGNLRSGWAQSISLDQEIATKIAAPTPRKTLHFGVQTLNYGGKEVRTVISYEGNDLPVSNEDSPWGMYNTVFSQIGADPTGAAALRARRHSVLDAVGKRYQALSPKLGAEDRQKLEAHLDAVRKLETQLDKPGTVLGGDCQLPVLSAEVGLGDPGNYPTIAKLQMDQTAMAFACDITRVATLQFSASTNNRPYPFLQYNGAAINEDEHILGHSPDDDVAAWGKLRVIRRWYAEQLAYLLGKLDAIPEGDGTLLDNTLVVLGSELARGNTHSHMDAPFILAGGAQTMKMGRLIDYANGGTDVSHNNLLVAMMNAMDVPGTTFGDPAFCNRPLTELFA
jgi:hypothetical protein